MLPPVRPRPTAVLAGLLAAALSAGCDTCGWVDGHYVHCTLPDDDRGCDFA